MNSPQLVPLPATETPADASVSDPLPSADPDQPRRNGKIAHLPKPQRDLINQGLDDGVKYEDIRARLAEQGVSLSLRALSDWFHGGYQDELKARERRAELRASQERLFEIARHDDAPDLSLVGLQLAVTQLSQQLYDLAPGSHKENFQTDTHNYLRMLNTLGRLSRSLLSLQQYRDEKAQSTAAELTKLDEDRDISDNECLLLVNRMDRVFRRRRPSVLSSSSPDCSSRREEAQISQPPSTSKLPPPAPQPEPPKPKIKPSRSSLRPASGQSSITAVAKEVSAMPAAPESDCRRRGPECAERTTTLRQLNTGGLGKPNEALIGEPPHASQSLGAPTPPVSAKPPSGTNPQIQQSINPSEIEERCHYCRRFLPPLLPNGQRPFDKCQHCGTALRLLELLHLYCPSCGARMDSIFDNGHRISDNCPNCFTSLPDAPDPPNAQAA